MFDGKGAAAAFVRTLGEAATRFGWRIHAYVVMRNHFHLALQISEPNLSEGMKWLQGTWVLRTNRYGGLVGRPFQGRFKALLVEQGHRFAQVCHYIHLNPVRAGLVTFDTYAEFEYSSYSAFRRRRRPGWLDPTTVLDAAGLVDSPKGWGAYLIYLEILSNDSSAQIELKSTRLSRGWCLGTSAFRKMAVVDVAERLRSRTCTRFDGVEPDGVQELKEAIWTERLSRFALAASIDLSALPRKKGASQKVLLAAAMKRVTSVSNAWLCSRLQMGAPDGLSVHIRRWITSPENPGLVKKLLEAGA